MSKQDEKKSAELNYKETLNLPRTDFPIRAQAHIFDPQLLERWKNEDLYQASYDHNKGKEKFVLHDGPPYANGNIHIGHAYNKILKDIVTKAERMTGKHVPIIPGWDCHGLPIELKVVKEYSVEDAVGFKKACRSYAQKWVDTQKEEFTNLGVLMNWNKPYRTMDFDYEAKIMTALGQFIDKGYIVRKQKTVPWCASCKTVLANAEIEYAERKDPSIYVQFALDQADVDQLLPQLNGAEASLLIWTTTPWTLPLNRAVVLKPGAMYQCVKLLDKYIIVGKDLVAKVAAAVGQEPEFVADIKAEDLIGKFAHHPFVENLQVPVIGDMFVSLDDGTACVHSAPGCGPEDYEIGLKNDLEIYSPVSMDGKYTEEIMPQELAGMPVSEGQIWVIKKLAADGKLFSKSSLRHSYPHCWRCQNGLIFRATTQWFCDLSQHSLKDKALESIEKLTMLPESGRKRLSATVDGRLEWCLSRQRKWGVPIPGVACRDCEYVYLTKGLIDKVAQGIASEGVEYWDAVDFRELLGKDFTCQECGSDNLKKEHDILDVWFDSGVSHFAVLAGNEDQAYPADLYLEGKDQHRGWFQSSLLTSLAINDAPSMKEIVTHGFTVDAKGHKMSKSRGNVVSPADLIKRMGTDGVRLWVASNDYDSDPVVSDALLNNVAEVYRKIRNTSRFMLSNLYDFDIEKDGIAVNDLLAVDKYALYKAHLLNEKIKQAYKGRKTTAVFHELADYCVKELSSFYLDIVKDRLYVEKGDGHLRRSAQTVCYYILDMLTRVMAPVLSFTAELLSDNYMKNKQSSIHLNDFADLSGLVASFSFDIDAFVASWDKLLAMRGLVLKELEVLRGQGDIKHSLDARVTLNFDDSSIANLFEGLDEQGKELFYKELFIVSQFRLQGEGLKDLSDEIQGKAERALGDKCRRCWQWESELFDEDKQLCQRCLQVLA